MAAENAIIDFGTKEVAGFVVNTQTIYMSWLTMALVAILLFAAGRNPKLVPGKLQLGVELIFDFILELVKGNLGEKGRKLVGSFFLTLFLYIFIGNELGFVPQIFTPLHVHITSPTNDINTTLGLGLLVIVIIQILGVSQHGLSYFKHFFQPSPIMFPIHLLDELLRPFTMAFRLFGNIVAGEILLVVLYRLAMWVFPEIWTGFSLAIGLIQALIFTALSICYMRGAFASHDSH
ncbi:MAG: F0F1 ATP synthase subunit A [Acidaminococcales bacterium]|nr:F0F1 ATP synthase subunit A [Acidaminococcales bacterium]